MMRKQRQETKISSVEYPQIIQERIDFLQSLKLNCWKNKVKTASNQD